MTDYRKGDVVHVKGECVGTMISNAVLVRFDCTHALVPVADIVKVEKRVPKVGDTVTWGSGYTKYRLVAIDGTFAWLHHEDFGFRTEVFSDLRLA